MTLARNAIRASGLLLFSATMVGCTDRGVIPTNCDYKGLIQDAIAKKYPGVTPPGRPLVLQRNGGFVEGSYPLPYVMPGGTTHAKVRIRDCRVTEVWVTQ